jgi:hypothetical protein
MAHYLAGGDKGSSIAHRLSVVGMKDVFLRRTRKHANRVAEEYRNELTKVALLNPVREGQARADAADSLAKCAKLAQRGARVRWAVISRSEIAAVNR